MKKSGVVLGILAFIFSLGALGAVAMELITIQGLALTDLFDKAKTWVAFTGMRIFFLVPVAIGALLFLVLFILVFTRNRPRKLFNGLNVLIVTAASSLMLAKVLSKDLIFFTMTGWTDLLNLTTAYEAGALLLIVFAFLFVLISAFKGIFAHDYKPRYAHVKLKDRKLIVEEKEEEKEEVKVEVKPEPTKVVQSAKVAEPARVEEKLPEPKVDVKVEEAPSPAPKEEVKEVVVRRIIEERVIVPVEAKKAEPAEEKPLYNFQKKRTTPKPEPKVRAKAPVAAPVKKEKVVAAKPAPVAKAAPAPKPAKVAKAKKVEPVEEVKEPATTGPSADGKRVYHLNKRDSDNKWTIIFAGGKRVIKLCDTQKEAIEYVEGLCANNGGTYLVHNSKGANKGRIKKK